MRRIICEIEQHPFKRARDGHRAAEVIATTEETIAAATDTAQRMLGAPIIIVFTKSGFSARIVSAHRPAVPILALTDELRTFTQLALVWGVIPQIVPHCETYEAMVARAREVVLSRGLAKEGDRVLVTAGVPFDVPGTTNVLRVERV
jgi:pyruvate kinase